MPTVVFQPGDRHVEVNRGIDLLAAAHKAGIHLEAPCGGRGTCGRCLVQVVSGEVEKGELGLLPREMTEAGYVLACRTRVKDSDLVVVLAAGTEAGAGKFGDPAADLALIDPALFPGKNQYQPLAFRWKGTVPPPGSAGGHADQERLEALLACAFPGREVLYPLSVWRKTAGALRATKGAAEGATKGAAEGATMHAVTLTLAGDEGALCVVDIAGGNPAGAHCGLAVDIGTTTLAVWLVNLADGTVVASACDYNSQLTCGLDVISRIHYAQSAERLAELRTRVLDTVNELTAQLLAAAALALAEVTAAVISGNTVMLHLLLGLDPEYIRLAPYTPTVLAPRRLSAGSLGLNLHPEAPVHLSPCVGSYVGGDITAGIFCTELAGAGEEIRLFIDIGTNGELVIGNCDFLMTCACSAGPAFEGSGIACGMRAAVGAVERVEIDPANGTARLEVIGGGAAQGICGSGIISLVAGLFKTGWLTPDGRLQRERPSPAIAIEGRRARYLLACASEAYGRDSQAYGRDSQAYGRDSQACGRDLWVSEQDIENILRAKAAIYAACSLLLEQVGLDFRSLATVYVAGGFGRFLNLRDAITIGLLPDLPEERFRFIGNSSLVGSYMLLLSAEHRRRQAVLAGRMTYLDLSVVPGYMEQYTAALFLPHTDRGLFPSVSSQGAM